MRLKNKIAVITGSSRGIGKAIALVFAKEGAKIIINYATAEQEAQKVVEEISKYGSEALAIKCDVSDEKQVERMVNICVKHFGKIDILVNNAGIGINNPFKEKTVEQWNRTLGVNLIGPFLCSKHFAPYINNDGRVINIASTNGIYSMHPESTDYDSSKAGVIAMTKGLAQELAPKICVNAIAPGWVATEMTEYMSEETIKNENEHIWLKRFGKPEEIAKVALFLASEDSSYVTGTTIIVDGGYYF